MRCSRNVGFILGAALLILPFGCVTIQAQDNSQTGIKNPTPTPTPKPTPKPTPTTTQTKAKLSISSGPQNGGNLVTITGSGFTDKTKVTFGQVPAQIITVQSGTITVVVPSRDKIGFVDVVISTPGKTALRARYQYKILPTSGPASVLGIIRVEPNTAFPEVENTFKITGRGFTPETKVWIDHDSIPAEVVSTGQLTIIVPRNRYGPGPLDIHVENPDNSEFTMMNGITFVGPKIFSIEPNRGLTAGGQQVRIRGLYLKVNNPADVVFGDIGATTKGKLEDMNENAISVDTPPHPPGWVDVVIHNAHNQTTTLKKAYYYEEERGPSAPPIKYSRLAFDLLRIQVVEDGAAGKGNIWSFDIRVNGKPLCNLETRPYKVGDDLPISYDSCRTEIDIDDPEVRIRVLGTRGDVWVDGQGTMRLTEDKDQSLPRIVEVRVEGNNQRKGFFIFSLRVVKLN